MTAESAILNVLPDLLRSTGRSRRSSRTSLRAKPNNSQTLDALFGLAPYSP